MRYQELHEGIIDNKTGLVMARTEIEKRLNEYDAWSLVDQEMEFLRMLVTLVAHSSLYEAESFIHKQIDKAFSDVNKREDAYRKVSMAIKGALSYEQESMWIDIKGWGKLPDGGSLPKNTQNQRGDNKCH